MKQYKFLFQMAVNDPQKVGRNISACEFEESTINAIYSVNRGKGSA
jgi:hypothetical protein